jgi:hypothetical protein
MFILGGEIGQRNIQLFSTRSTESKDEEKHRQTLPHSRSALP